MGGRGSGGKNRRPNHLKILEGAEERHINRLEPIPSDYGDIRVPEGMEPDVRRVWDRYAPDMIAKKVLTAWDVDAFLIVCQAVALRAECWRKMRNPADEDSGLMKKGSGGVIPSPLFRIMAQCNADIARFGGRFGMTPGDRAGLKVDADEAAAGGAERLLS